MSSDPNAQPADAGPIQPRKPSSVYRDPSAAVPGSQRLEEDERHPVVIFGSSKAGKSTLIMSIINALEKSAKDGGVGVNVSFGSSFYAKRDAMAQAQLDIARNFYDAASTNFIIGREALETTQADLPFFIPLDLRIRGSGLRPVKIAIMDGRGEWYEPDKTGIAPFRDLQKYIVEVLKNYSRGMSIICVAPYSLGSTDEDNVQNSDAGLWAALNKYQELRSESDDDALLFLLTKWDQVASPGKVAEFTHLDGEHVAEIAARRYRRSWNNFLTARVGADDWEKRCFMQYSSCRFVEGRPWIPPELEDEFLRYPRTVMNWIFGNARRFEFSVGRQVTELPLNLFPDVIPRGTKMIPLSERFLRRIAG
jgi:hypothetical protein